MISQNIRAVLVPVIGLDAGFAHLKPVAGGIAMGTYVGGMADPQIVEIIGHAGFDAAFIDMEHTSFDLRDVQLMVMAAERVGISPIVRPPGFDPAFLLRLLDMGVQGVQIPHISNVEAARAAVQDTDYIAGYVKEVLAAREMVYQGLEKLGIPYFHSQANFVLVLFEGALTAEAAYKGLMDEGYIVRWLPGQGLPHGLRITIGTEEETRAVAAILNKLVAETQQPATAG